MLFKKLTVSVLAVLFTLILCEVVLSFLFPKSHEYYPSPQIKGIYSYAENSVLKERHVGELSYMAGKHYGKPVTYYTRTNANGYTVPKYNQPNSGKDIVVIGDSYSVCSQMHDGISWVDSISHNKEYTVTNLSVAGAGPWQELIAFKHYLQSCAAEKYPDLVIWPIFSGNDLDDYYQSLFSLNHLQKNWWERSSTCSHRFYRQRTLVTLFNDIHFTATAQRHFQKVSKMQVDGDSVLFFNPYIENGRRGIDAVLSHPNHPLLSKTFSDMVHMRDSMRFDLLCVFFPSKEEMYSKVLGYDAPRGFEEAMKNLCYQSGVPFVSYYEPLEKAVKSGHKPWLSDDTHFSAYGHKIVAANILMRLQERSTHR